MKNQWYLTPLPNAPDLSVTGHSETLFKPWIHSQPRSLTHDMKSLAQSPINKTGYPQALYSSLKTTDTLKLQILKSWSKWLPGIFLPFKDKSKSINSLKTIKATVIYKLLYSNNDMRKQWLIRIKVPVGISRVNVWMFHLSPLHQALP